MHISEKRRTKKNKLEKRAELGIFVRYENIYIYKIYVLTRREEKIVRTSNVRFDETKGLTTDKKEKEEFISIKQNPPNKERTLTTLNNFKILKLDINK